MQVKVSALLAAEVKKDILKDLPTAAGASDVRPFVEDIENLSRLYNDPVMLFADEDAIYILPAEATSEADGKGGGGGSF
jgi:hypothetical protein